MPSGRLGILAGGGELPMRVIEACRATGRDYFVLAFEGQTNPATVEGSAHAWVPIGAVGEAFGKLRQAGVGEVVLAGPVKRPSLSELRPDLRAAAFLARIGAAAFGDDGLLSAIVREIEREGFHVVGADDILDALRTPEGSSGAFAPDDLAQTDIVRGVAVAQTLGLLDVGQAVVVQQGLVLGLEAIEGTDELLRRCAALRRNGPGGVLVKMSKPAQERRVDLPAIGVATVRNAAAAGLRGIALEAQRSLIIDRPAVVRAADAARLFVFGVKVEE